MNFFRCRFCGITQDKVNISDNELEALLQHCPGCGADHFAEGYAEYRDPDESEVEHDFVEGQAAIGYDGDTEYRGVITGVYDDVVEIEYNDRPYGFDTMEFHIDHVEAL